MKKLNPGINTVDDLLKQALKDDLPHEVETGMKRQLNHFREKMENAERGRQYRPTSFFSRLLNSLEPKARRQLVRQVLPAFASILLIVLGSLLQMNGSQNVLAESISVWKAAVHTTNQVQYYPSMTCSVEALMGNEKPLKYSIQWLDADHSRAQVHGPGLNVEKKRLVKDKEKITIETNPGKVGNTDNLENTRRTVKRLEGIQNINDPIFQPVLHLLSPPGLVSLLDGKWLLKEYRQEGGCEWGTFAVLNPRKNTRVEITTDLCTCLPVSMKMSIPTFSEKEGKGHILMNVRFKWNPPVSPVLMNHRGNSGDGTIDNMTKEEIK